MLYSDRPIPYLFVHNPRTGGTSISLFLVQYCNGVYKKKYGLADNIHSAYASTARDWSSHYRFGFVRNPFSRELSLYQLYAQLHSMNISFKEWVMCRHGEQKLNVNPRIEKVILHSYPLPQYGYFCNERGKIDIEVFKFERRIQALEKITNILKVKQGSMSKHRPESRNSPRFDISQYRSHYDNEMIDIMYRKMYVDLKYFGYGVDGEEPVDASVTFEFTGDPDLYHYNYQNYLF